MKYSIFFMIFQQFKMDSSRRHLTLLYANNSGTDQPAQINRLVTGQRLFIRYLNKIVAKLDQIKISLFLVASVAEQSSKIVA